MAEMQRWALVATLDAHRVAGKIGLASGEGCGGAGESIGVVTWGEERGKAQYGETSGT